tara:strand:- start:36071 stop:36370 length:300 start_codon:yes stop_codon:yes gene_type:complete
MADFTKGPWTFSRRGQRVYGGITNGRNIAQISVVPEFEANGRLIAAAPELLSVAKAIDGMWSDDGEGGRCDPEQARSPKVTAVWIDLRAAIAKALGEQS